MRVVIVAEWYIVANCYSAMREHSGIVGDSPSFPRFGEMLNCLLSRKVPFRALGKLGGKSLWATVSMTTITALTGFVTQLSQTPER